MRDFIKNLLPNRLRKALIPVLHFRFFSKIESLIFYISFKTRKENHAAKKKALFYISQTNPTRRLFQIFSHFLYCGYSCCFDISFAEFMKLDRYGKKATALKGVYPKNKISEKYSVIVSDDNKFLENADNEAYKIFINFRIFTHINNVSQNDFFYPISPHIKYNCPLIEADILSKSSLAERKICAVFAGNNSKNSYNKDITKKIFGVNTRFEVFSYLLDKLPKNILYIPDTLESFISDIERGYLKEKIVLVDTSNFEVPSKSYFDILLASSFYIHMCGITYPYCHNQIESMMAGCIPITQFSNFFVPPFEHEKSGFLYTTLDELVETLIKISTGDYNETIPLMRKNILDYYYNHYSFDSFNTKLLYLIENKVKHSNYHIVSGSKQILDELLL